MENCQSGYGKSPAVAKFAGNPLTIILYCQFRFRLDNNIAGNWIYCRKPKN
jgi:hypothetical protein